LSCRGSRHVEGDGRAGYLVLDEEPDKLVEEHAEIVAAGQVVVLIDDPVVGQANRLQLRFAAVSDHDLYEHRLAVVRLDREHPPGHLQPGPGLGPLFDGRRQNLQREGHDADYRTPRPHRRCGMRRSRTHYRGT
jgi:hypothetical protein